MAEQRKLVTVLFVDTSDSTALGERLDPEDLRALMGRYYAHARRIIAEHGGTVEKFIGDAVMAVFGLPQAHSNDAERALAATLALRDAVAGDPVLGGHLLLRIGVNTGEVVATDDSSGGDFLVTGDAVNVAARLEQAARPGEILASERAAIAARASFQFGAARLIEVKGKRLPLRVLPVSSQRPARELGRPPLVGRKADLALLAVLRDRALDERRPQLVSVLAPAGTGKTRLVEEFLDRLPPKAGFRVATARCVPYGQALTYWPLRGLLDELLGSEAVIPAVVAGAFTAGGLSERDAVRLAGVVLATLGIAPDQGARQGETDRESVFSAWRLLIETLAAQAPRIVIFEDLHWASESLLDLVEFVLQPRTEAALLVMATSRPELLDRRPAWGGGRRNFTALALEPLRAAEAEILVGKLARQLPAATRARIVERAGGNPFFLLELARGQVERARYVSAAEDSAAPHAIPDALPDTVQEALQEQLDLLPPHERAVLQAAAVAGRQFRPATVAAVLPEAAPAELAASLDGLLARALITPAADGAYLFRHILIRDVAYRALSRAERIRMHTAVAEWLEHFAAGREEEFVELVAYHYREAARLARRTAVPLSGSLATPPDASRAVHYLELAGRRAAHTGAFVEAREHLESAIELAAESEQQRLYEILGDSEMVGTRILPAYRQALARWRASAAPDPLVGARLLRKALASVYRWEALRPHQDGDEVAALRAEAWRLSEQSGDEYERRFLRVLDVFWPAFIGKAAPDAEAEAQLTTALEAADYFEARGDVAACSEALDAYTSCASGCGDYASAAAASRRRLALPSLPAHEREDALGMLVRSEFEQGAYADGMATARAAIVGRSPGTPASLFVSSSCAAIYAAYWTGRWSEVGPFAATCEEFWEENRQAPHGSLGGYWTISMLLALAREDQGTAQRCAAAARFFEGNWSPELRAALEAWLHDDPGSLQAALRAQPSLYGYGVGFLHLAILQFLSEHGLPAPRNLLEFLTIASALSHSDLVRRSMPIAEALAADDDLRLAAAIEDAEAHELIPHAARMRIVLARRTGDLAQLERAQPVLERLGDRQGLRRLGEVAADLSARQPGG